MFIAGGKFIAKQPLYILQRHCYCYKIMARGHEQASVAVGSYFCMYVFVQPLWFLVLILVWVVLFSFVSSHLLSLSWFCQKCNLQEKIRDRLFLCGLQARLILMYSVWLLFSHMWVHVYCLDERESWWFSEMLVIILPLLFFLRDVFHTRTSKVSLHCTRLSHSLSVPSSLRSLSSFLKGFFHCSFIFYFTSPSCRSWCA